MRSVIFVSAVLLFATPALAWTNNCSSGASCNAVDNGAIVQNKNSQLQGQIQKQSVNNAANNSNRNSNSVRNQVVNNNVVNVDPSGDPGPDPYHDGPIAGPSISVAIAASGPCVGAGGSGSIGYGLFGIGGAAISIEKQCEQREILRIALQSGNRRLEREAAVAAEELLFQNFPDLKGDSRIEGRKPVPGSQY